MEKEGHMPGKAKSTLSDEQREKLEELNLEMHKKHEEWQKAVKELLDFYEELGKYQ